MKLAVFKQNDRRVAINTDAIISIQEVTEVDGNDYVAIILDMTNLYFSDYSHDHIIKSLKRDKEIYKNTIGDKDTESELFFTFNYKGKKLSFRTEDVLFIQETDLEEGYYLTICLRNGVKYNVEGLRFNESIHDLAWTVFINPQEEERNDSLS